MYHYTECGLPNVWLVNGYGPHPTPYGEAVIIENVTGLHRAIAMGLVKDKPRLTGIEFRFLRGELDLSQKRLADTYFGNSEQAVALWEKRGRVPKWADRFIRFVYSEDAEGNAQISEIVHRLNELDQKQYQRQVFEESEGAWMPAAA